MPKMICLNLKGPWHGHETWDENVYWGSGVHRNDCKSTIFMHCLVHIMKHSLRADNLNLTSKSGAKIRTKTLVAMWAPQMIILVAHIKF